MHRHYLYSFIHTGGYVYPCGGFSASDSNDINLPTPPEQPSSRAPRLAHLPALTTLHEPCSSDSEDEHPGEAHSRKVEVEVHIEPASDASDNSPMQGSELQEGVDFEQPVHLAANCSEMINYSQEQGNTQRPKLQREQCIHSHSDRREPDDMMDQPLLTSTTSHFSIVAEPPTSMPVQVPYLASSLPASERPKLSLPVKQHSAGQVSSPLKRFLQLPHKTTTPTTVLKLKARRGFQLKLKIPTEKVDTLSFHTMKF